VCVPRLAEGQPLRDQRLDFLFAGKETLAEHQGLESHCTVASGQASSVNADDPLLLEYHDREWGVPVHNDRKHFEVLVLSGAQAGLNWSLVLKKREGYRRAFDKFNPEKVARYCERQIQTLLSDHEIIRNRMKIEAAVRNARAFLKIQEEFGCFDSYCWRFVGG
jgi:DNA-3-methyladenine glycosylase I